MIRFMTSVFSTIISFLTPLWVLGRMLGTGRVISCRASGRFVRVTMVVVWLGIEGVGCGRKVVLEGGVGLLVGVLEVLLLRFALVMGLVRKVAILVAWVVGRVFLGLVLVGRVAVVVGLIVRGLLCARFASVVLVLGVSLPDIVLVLGVSRAGVVLVMDVGLVCDVVRLLVFFLVLVALDRLAVVVLSVGVLVLVALGVLLLAVFDEVVGLGTVVVVSDGDEGLIVIDEVVMGAFGDVLLVRLLFGRARLVVLLVRLGMLFVLFVGLPSLPFLVNVLRLLLRVVFLVRKCGAVGNSLLFGLVRKSVGEKLRWWVNLLVLCRARWVMVVMWTFLFLLLGC